MQGSSEVESEQYGSDTSGANNAAGAPRRRKRSVAAADYYGNGYGAGPSYDTGAPFAAPEDLLPVPKRVRTTARAAPGGPHADASPSPR